MAGDITLFLTTPLGQGISRPRQREASPPEPPLRWSVSSANRAKVQVETKTLAVPHATGDTHRGSVATWDM